jgi:hypothetical protein
MRDLKADLALCDKATPGPWKANAAHTFVCAGKVEICFNSFHAEEAEDNIAFISAAREAWPEAIRRALAAEARVKELEAAIHAECRRCAEHNKDLERAEDCRCDTCPLWPHRSKREEATP